MRYEDIRRILRAQPFRPFHMYIHETTVYEIRHPEQVLIGQSTVTIFLAGSGSLPLLGEQEIIIALLHITKIIPFAQAGPWNGA